MMIIDSDLNLEQYSLFGGDNAEYSPTRGCGQTSDGGYTMCGFTTSYTAEGGGAWDIWQIKTDADLNMEWENLYGGTGYENCWGMQLTSDNGIVLAIAYNLGSLMGTREDLLLVKTDEMGNIIVNVLFEETGRQIPIFIRNTTDGGFIICGRTGSGDDTSSDSILIKISNCENQRPDKPDKPEPTNAPKPTNEPDTPVPPKPTIKPTSPPTDVP